jgi:capsular exopolysaccharide synthesis family protein
MSRDFELLRKVELGGTPTRRFDRRELFPEFAGPAGDTDLHGAVRPVEQTRLRESEWVKAFIVVRKRWRLTACFAAIVVCLAAVVVFWIKPEYEPWARLEVDPPGSETFSMQAAGSSFSESQYLDTQTQSLQTDDLAIAVIRKLGLDKNSEFAPGVSAESVSTDPLRLTPAENSALHTLRSRLKVLHDPNGHVIAVSVTAHDPQLAANITNSVAQTFVDRTLKARHDTIASSRAWLEGQLEGVRAKAEQSNRELAAFQKQTGVADIDEGRNTFGDLMTDLNKQQTQVQSERIQLQSFIQKAEAGGVDSLPQVRENPVVQKLTQNLAEVRAQLSQELVIYGVNHPNTKKLQSQADELEKQLTIQRKEALDQLRTSYDAARAREKLMAGQKHEASKTIGEMAQYNALKKQAQAQDALYNSLLGRVEEAGIAAASQSSNIRVIDPARILYRPTRPHRLYALGLGLFAGLLGGVVLAFVREKLDRLVRTPQDIRDWTGIPSVSVIPEFAGNGFRGLVSGLTSRRTIADGPAKFLLERPHSPESEAVRALDANIVLANAEQPQAVLVTSSLPGEGKTTVAVNLALALSQHGRTCLVDADLRRACVAATFGLHTGKGLGDVLLGSTPLDEALVIIEDSPNLVILPAGQPSEDRAHLIVSMAMKSVMTSLRSQFDFIIVDSAPIIPYADGRALSTVTDGIVFVTRSGITPGDAMVRSMELLSEVQSAPVVKVVLNAHDFSARDYSYSKYKSY